MLEGGTDREKVYFWGEKSRRFSFFMLNAIFELLGKIAIQITT